MADANLNAQIAEQAAALVKRGFTPRFGKLASEFPSNPVWKRIRALGTELWLDTGSLEESARLWTREFTALTTNNTLLNKEVQRGQYDRLIAEAAAMLSRFNLSPSDQLLEIAFILNARHGLRLVEKYDAFVSVEEHTDLANDADSAVRFAERYHAICPERFIVKIPFTAAGLLATRRIAAKGIPVNHTLGFSARQNYVIARIGRPRYVNVFLGRLNSFVADNKLGDGAYVGEKATLASQAAVRALRRQLGISTRQIGASMRAGGQVRDLAGLDVFTMPPAVAAGFLALQIPPDQLQDRTSADYTLGIAPGADVQAVRLNTLWDIEPKLVSCLDALERENLDAFSPSDLVDFLAQRGCGDIFPRWTESEVAASLKEGKIPQLSNWKSALASGRIGLDSLMNLAGLNSFIADQKAMDDRVRSVLAQRG